jgi:NADPH:quinone reductase-like Zn-dependent oxidoreductase
VLETEAWILEQGDGTPGAPGELVLGRYSFPEPDEDEVLVAPLYGTWEGNMTHALTRIPVDICRVRLERRIVLGNAGVVRVLETGARVRTCRGGDVCVVIPIGKADAQGYPTEIYAYDNRGSVGLLARLTKLRQDQLVPIPSDSPHSLLQWAATSVRYATAWDNWRMAWACWQAQFTGAPPAAPHVWGWGGGVALAELLLAHRAGCRVAMIASTPQRLDLIASLNITPIDRGRFRALSFDTKRFEADSAYRAAYTEAEGTFLRRVREVTGGERVSIFIDHIGTPVLRATLKALGRYGVITTAGWEAGTAMSFRRPSECLARHIHVFTHGASYEAGRAAIAAAARGNWLLPVGEDVYEWQEVPALAADFAAGRTQGYFPVYKVNGD